MKFAFLIIGSFNIEQDRASIHDGTAQIIGIADMQEAIAVARQLCEDGIDCIELCGAFGPDGAREIMDATKNKVPVGYITHLPEQDAVFKAAFSKS